MKKRILILLVVCLFLLPIVYGVGTCSFSKYIYHPDETGTFSCSCTSSAEENKAGYIVFRNTSTVLQNVSINSGSCTAGVFGDSYTFLTNQNFTGNATFSLNDDGTGYPTSWGAGEVSDTFNVTGAHTHECIINISEAEIRGFTLGRMGAIEFSVLDPITSYPLVHIGCQAHAKDINGTPLFVEPYPNNYGVDEIKTNGDGYVILQHFMNEDFWVSNSTYQMDINCYCTPNSTDEECYIGSHSEGAIAEFKSCNADVLFKTSAEDYRTQEGNAVILAILILLPILFGFMLLYGANSLSEDHSVLSIGMFLLSLVTFWSSLHYGLEALLRYFHFDSMVDLIGQTTFYYGTAIFVIILYFIIYTFIKLVKVTAQKKKERLEY